MKKYTVVLNIQVSDNWIEDGFDMTEKERKEQLSDAVRAMLPYAHEHEIKVDVEVTEILPNPNAEVEKREADKTIQSFTANHTKNKKTILYKDHAGSLEESMKTVQEVTCETDIINHLNKFWKDFGKEVEELKFKRIGFDERIGWDTYIVRFRLKGSATFEVAGHTNGSFTQHMQSWINGRTA
mgnify:CR=1 FL=1